MAKKKSPPQAVSEREEGVASIDPKEAPAESFAPLSRLGRLVTPAAEAVLHQVQDASQGVMNATRDLAQKASEEVDGRGVAGGVVAMSAGEAVGMALGGVIGSVVGPGGTVLGAQIGGFAGSSLGARYGYDLAVRPPENSELSPKVVAPGDVLAKRGAERLGEAVGEAGGLTLGAVFGGPMTRSVFGHLGGGVGGSIGEHAVETDSELPENAEKTSDSSYRKAPTQAWLKRIAKENLAETVISAALGAAGGLVGGVVGQKVAERAGIVAARHLNFTDASEPEFVEPSSIQGSESDTPLDNSSSEDRLSAEKSSS